MVASLLRDSKLVRYNDGKDGSLRQDRYSIRTACQWLGPVIEDLVLAQQQIMIECNSVTDNPIINERGQSLHGGNFQAKSVTSAMEKIKQGIHTIGRMLFAQCTEIINPATNRGLPPNLVGEEPDTSFIFKGIDIHVAALQSELGFLAGPVNHVNTAEMGNQSLNSLALIAARYAHTSINVLFELIAAHLVTTCQALDLRVSHRQFLTHIRPLFSLLIKEELSTLTNDISTSAFDENLWSHLEKAFDSTTSMNSSHRFGAITRDIKMYILEEKSVLNHPNALNIAGKFAETLRATLEQHWRIHQDQYLASGDATPYLGLGSRPMYHFLRHDLGIPCLSSSTVATPVLEREDPMDGNEQRDPIETAQAPTIGSFTATVYRALRDGTAHPILRSLLEMSCRA